MSGAPISSAAVIGAGIGGLVAGIALARAGIAVDLYEQADELGEVGAGITISPNADRVLAHLGLGPALHALAYVPERQITQHWQTGEILRDVERGPEIARRYGAGYYHLHRADLALVLAEAFEREAGARLHTGHRLETCTPEGALTFVGGTRAEAEFVIGADGVKSAVRGALFDPAPPKFTGQVAWRGIVPVERLAETSALRRPGIHIGPGRLVARYPIRAGELINYAAFVELDGWRGEGWMIRSSVPELTAHFAGADPELLALFEASPEDQVFKWALHAREPLETWSAGRVTLLGDAAHPMLPFMGQGAGTAIEDAMVLTRALAAFGPQEAMAAYERARRERTALIQLNSRLMGQQFQSSRPESFGSTPIRDEEALGLFGYDAVEAPLDPLKTS